MHKDAHNYQKNLGESLQHLPPFFRLLHLIVLSLHNKPEEIEKIESSKYKDYQQSGPNPENPDELSIKEKDVTLDQSS